MTHQEKIALLYKVVGYVHLAIGVMSAIFVGTMGKMPGRNIAYPRRVRYTQGVISVALLVAGACWLSYHLLIAPATLLWMGLFGLQMAFMMHLSMAKLDSRESRLTFMVRTLPFALLIIIAASWLIGWSMRGHSFEELGKELLTTQREILHNTTQSKQRGKRIEQTVGEIKQEVKAQKAQTDTSSTAR